MALVLDLLKQCERCDLKEGRTQVVLPKGSISSNLMFVGEAPGRNEDREGVPFVGTAGKWMDEILDILGLTEYEYYITNTVKCRPTNVKGNNRAPTDEEIHVCGDWLREEINIINPKVIVLMGNTALRGFFNNVKISNVAGSELLGHNLSKNRGIRLFALYHPAVMIYREEYYKPLYITGIKNLKRLLGEEGIL